jgi:hypothetical protein
VLLHEFGHGLGFSTTTSGSTGNYLNGPPALPALWDKFLYRRDDRASLEPEHGGAACGVGHQHEQPHVGRHEL